MNRRHFIQTSLASSIAIPAFALEADNPYRASIGIQLYTVRNPLKDDPKGTLESVAKAGYQQVEPFGFPDADEIIKISRDLGMAVNSSHFAWESVTDPERKGALPFDEILQKAVDIKLTHLVIPYLRDHNRRNLDDYKRVAERCNAAAVKAKAAGIQLCYHNHAFEFQPMEGERSGFDVFIDEFAPEMLFEVDVFWVKAGGREPVDLLKKLPGRVAQLHLKDLKKGLPIPDFGKLPNDAFEELGDGVIPMGPILEASPAAGVVHAHVEQDQSPDPLASIAKSYGHLQTL